MEKMTSAVYESIHDDGDDDVNHNSGTVSKRECSQETTSDNNSNPTGEMEKDRTSERSYDIFETASMKYDNYDEAQLEEFAKIVSPKVSELLSEEALALDTFLGNDWSSSDDDSRFGRKSRSKGKKYRHFDDDEEDEMNDEWRRLECAQNDLRNELNLATNGFSAFLFTEESHDGYFDKDLRKQEDSSFHLNNQGKLRPSSNCIHQEKNGGDPNERHFDYPQSIEKSDNSKSIIEEAPGEFSHSKSKQPYSLSDHALTLGLTRDSSNRAFSRPLLSQRELETLNIITLPEWILRSRKGDHEYHHCTPVVAISNSCDDVNITSNHSAKDLSLDIIQNTSPNRQSYMRKVLSSMREYVEPLKSKILPELFSGWNPAPGERRTDDKSARCESLENSQRIVSYSTSTYADENGDSSDDEESKDENDNSYIDVDGLLYSTEYKYRYREPLPVRTVTIRIRPDVLCGSVMDALTNCVEKLGGNMTKRQGNHLRAILPERRLTVWMRDELDEMKMEHRKMEKFSNESEFDYEVVKTVGKGGGSSDLDGVEEYSSLASELSSLIWSTPGKLHSRFFKGPKCTVFPPYLVDAQLVTKKLGKTCQRLLLIRVFRIQDLASFRMNHSEEEEVLHIPESIETSSVRTENDDCNNNHGFKIQRMNDERVDVESEIEHCSKSLQEAAALAQRINAVGPDGFSIDSPSPVFDPLEDVENASVASHSSTKSYLSSISNAIASPTRFFSSSKSSVFRTSIPSSTQFSSNLASKEVNVVELMSNELLKKYHPSPSVGVLSKSAFNRLKRKSHGVFPSLSKDDSPYVKASWIFLRDCIKILDERCLSYSSLGICPIFESPALPTLDSQFISQVKAFCREAMIISLVKTASDLEVYAREFELSCRNLDVLLYQTFRMYKLPPIPLPTPLPLTAYPLDFHPPEDIQPPWGPEVAKVLDEISRRQHLHSSEHEEVTDRNVSCFDRAEQAVLKVVVAFHRQNDLEQGARLGRKNIQVIDRLAKMQAHKRNSIAKITNSYGSNFLATNAADEFHSLRLKSSNVESLSDIMHSIPDQIPLLICDVIVGNASGKCYVTCSQILFDTNLIPIIGGSRVHLFCIMDIEAIVNPSTKSMLSSVPASITLTSLASSESPSRFVYNFIPSIGAHRFAKFLEVVKDVSVEDPNTLKFSDRGGLIYDMNDKSL